MLFLTESFDVLIVGAGPAGSTAARYASKYGLKTILLEEHASVGLPTHCTGKLVVEAFQEFDISKKCILNQVRGAIFLSPSNFKFAFAKDTAESYIMDRVLFDRLVAEQAEGDGAKLLTSARVTEISKQNDGYRIVKIQTKNGLQEVRTHIIIDAEGASQRLLSQLNVEGSPLFLKGLQYELDCCNIERKDYVEVYMGKRLAPGFFSWFVPVTDQRARVGICINQDLTESSVRKLLDGFSKDHPELSHRVQGSKILSVFGGLIPLHGIKGMTYGDGFLIIGDAAGHNKSTSGGGIYFGMKGGKMAAQTALDAVEENNFSRNLLRSYESRWKRSFGNELKFTSKARKLLDSFSDNDLDMIINVFSKSQVLRSVVEAHGDTARQSCLWSPMMKALSVVGMKQPSALSVFAKMAWKAFLVSLF